MHEVEFALLENALGEPLRTDEHYRVWGQAFGTGFWRFGIFDPSHNDHEGWEITFADPYKKKPITGTFAEILAIVSDPAWQRKHLACGKITPSK